MFDGSVKVVEDIRAGDLLMGPDSTPRTVLRLIRGEDELVDIVPVKGERWTVNPDHVLSLVNNRKYLANRITDLTVREYEARPPSWKHTNKLFRVGVDFPTADRPLPLPPYIVGALLGDGSLAASSPSITTMDPEIAAEVVACAEMFGATVRVRSKPGNKASTYEMVHADGKARAGHRHPAARLTLQEQREAIALRAGGMRLWEVGARFGVSDKHISALCIRGIRAGAGAPTIHEAIKAAGIHGMRSGDKRIPHAYKTASREERLDLLAGLVDTDGSRAGGGYDYVSKSKWLANDVAFVARSLGLAAYVSECEKSCQGGFTGAYHRVSISGDCSVVPVRVPRKATPRRRQIKSVLRTGMRVEKTGRRGRYYGFQLDGDRRYLLDDFTVTHNSGKSRLLAEITAWAVASGAKVVISTPSQSLVRQLWRTVADRVGARIVGQMYAHRQEPQKQVVVVCHDSMPQLAAALQQMGQAVDLWIADEAHKTERDQVKQAIEAMHPRRRLGVTATPFRSAPGETLSMFRELVYSYTVGDALRDGVLVPPRVQFWTDEDVTDINDVVVQMIRRHKVQGPGVISAASIQDAEDFAERLESEGIPAMAIHSGLPIGERNKRTTWLRDSGAPTRALVHPSLLAEGVDMPWLRWGALRRRVSSRVRFVQEVGRYLRVHPGKDHAVILDPYALFTLHSISNPAALGEPADDPKLVKEMLEEEPFPLVDLPPLAVLPPAVAVDATAAWARALLMLMEQAGHHTPHDTYGKRDAKWRRRRATGKQIAALERMAWATRVIPEPHKSAVKAVIATPGRLRAGVASDMLDTLRAVADASESHRKARMRWPWPDTMEIPPLPKRVIRGLG